MIPNYTQDIETVLRSAAETLMRTRRTIEHLTHCELQDPKLSRPSWVPDLTSPKMNHLLICRRSMGCLSAVPRIEHDIVHAYGQVIATINDIHIGSEPFSLHDEFVVPELERILCGIHLPVDHGQTEALLATLVNDNFADTYRIQRTDCPSRSVISEFLSWM